METTSQNQIDGATVHMGGKDWNIPPLSLKLLRKYQVKLSAFGQIQDGALPTNEQLETMINLVLDNMNRVYPDLTMDQLEDMMDVSNCKEIFMAVMGVSGLVKKEGEASPGEQPGSQ